MDVLKSYLQYRFYEDNSVKYHHYFQLWYDNLTKSQKMYFDKDYKKTLN